MNPDEKLGKKMSCPVEVVMADQRLARIDALFVTHSGLHVLVSKKEKAKASNWTQGALMDDRREAKKIYVPNLKDLAAGFTEALTEYMCQYTCASLPKSCPNLFDGYYNFGVQLRCCDSCLGILVKTQHIKASVQISCHYSLTMQLCNTFPWNLLYIHRFLSCTLIVN